MRLICLFVLVAFSASAQNSLTGIVTDSVTGEKIPGANIYIPELHKGTVSDIEGKYSIENIPDGNFKVQFSFVGYETIIKTVFFKKENLTIDVSLEQAVVESHEIVVSAAYTSSQDETPVKVDQLSKEQMNKNGGITLSENITKIPGINQISTGVSIGKPVIRGLSGNRVVVYSQGLRMENQQWGSEHGLGLSDMGIERVEIIKGPASLLYGSDAMGGALHLVDEKPANIGELKGEYRAKFFSNTQGYSNGIRVKGAEKIIRFNIGANTQSHADYLDGNNTRITNTRFNEDEFKSSFGFTKSSWVSNTTYHYINSKLGITGGIGKQNSDKNILLPFQDVASQMISSQNSFFRNDVKIKLNAGYMLNNRKEFEDEENIPNLNMKLNTLNYDAKVHFPFSEKAEYIFGIQGLNQENRNSGKEILIPDAKTNDAGGVCLAILNLEKTTLQFGGRYDIRKINALETRIDSTGILPSFSKNFQSFNASAGGAYNANTEMLFRFNIASGFRAPNLAELASKGAHYGTFRYEIGNPNLKKEQNIQADLSNHFHSKHISLDIAGFYNYIMNYIFLFPTDSIAKNYNVYEYRQDDASLFGGEFTIDVHPHPLDWLHFETNFSTVTGKQKNGNYLPLIPANKMNNSIVIDIEDNNDFQETYFKIEFTSVSAQRDNAPDEKATPSYNLVNIGVGSKVKIGKQQANFSFTVNNLFNEKYYDHLSRLKTYGIYNAGRNISLNINIPFGLVG